MTGPRLYLLIYKALILLSVDGVDQFVLKAQLIEGPFHALSTLRTALQIDEEDFVKAQSAFDWWSHEFRQLLVSRHGWEVHYTKR